MGKLSIILVFGAIFTSGILLFQVQERTLGTDDRVWEHQHYTLARDAASTGLSVSVRRLAQHLYSNGWNGGLPAPSQDQGVPNNGGRYDVQTTNGSCSALSSTALNQILSQYTASQSDLMESVSTGAYDAPGGANGVRRHQMVACYLVADWNDPTPPGFMYAFISNGEMRFNGGVEVTVADELEGYGNIHSNETIRLGPQVDIQGHVTVTETEGNNVHKNADVVSYNEGTAPVPVPPFDPEEFRTDNGVPPAGSEPITTATFRYDRDDSGTVTIGDSQTIGPPGGCDALCQQQPFIWFVDGNLKIQANHLVLPQYTIIVTTGEIDVLGNSNVTFSGTLPDQHPDLNDWVNAQLVEGSPTIAWYGGSDVTLSGNGSVVGNFYTNGDFTLQGGGQGGNLVGSVAAVGDITANGGGGGTNFIYAQVSEETVIPGVLLPGKQIVRIALAEWTGPLLANTN